MVCSSDDETVLKNHIKCDDVDKQITFSDSRSAKGASVKAEIDVKPVIASTSQNREKVNVKPEYETLTDTDDANDGDGAEPDAATVAAYFVKVKDLEKTVQYRCKACQRLVKAQRGRNSNLHTHQSRCPKLHKALRNGVPGITNKNRLRLQSSSSITIDPRTGGLTQPFSQDGVNDFLHKWVIGQGLPFTAVQAPELHALLRYCNPAIRAPCANTVRNHISAAYERCRAYVDARLAALNCTVHYAHDAWTDSERRNSFFGIYVSFIDCQYQYQEILLRLCHLQGIHSGVRIGDGLFELFSQVGITNRLGPGTGDNASNNLAAARQLSQRLEYEANYLIESDELVGCICHIANLAAHAFLKAEGKFVI